MREIFRLTVAAGVYLIVVANGQYFLIHEARAMTPSLYGPYQTDVAVVAALAAFATVEALVA